MPYDPSIAELPRGLITYVRLAETVDCYIVWGVDGRKRVGVWGEFDHKSNK